MKNPDGMLYSSEFVERAQILESFFRRPSDIDEETKKIIEEIPDKICK